MPADDPLTERELAFRALIAGVDVNGRTEVNPVYSRMCAEACAQWEREHGVEWLHGAQWLPRRPQLDPERPATFRFNPARAAAYAAKAAAAKAAASSASMGDAPRTGTHPRTRG